MRSDNVTKGSERAPNRSLFYALGYTKEELERPLIGVVSQHFGCDNLSLGGEVELSNNFGSTGGFKCRPCLGVKWDF